MSLKGTHCVLSAHVGASTPRPWLMRNGAAGHAPNTGAIEGFSPDGRKKFTQVEGYTLMPGLHMVTASGLVVIGAPPRNTARYQFSTSRSVRTGLELIGRFRRVPCA